MVISCKEDMQNQSIKTLADKVDPEGRRTIGVLTKPDRIEKGCHEQFLQVLRGEKFLLRLGYFVVKNPDQAELDAGLSPAAARQREMEYFSNTSPWNQMKKTCGTPGKFGGKALMDFLGRLLEEKIRAGLKNLGSAVQVKTHTLEEKIAHISNGFDEKSPRANLLFMIAAFQKQVADHVEAKDGMKEFIKSVFEQYAAFCNGLVVKRPLFSVGNFKFFISFLAKF